ncbi:MAG TPA: GAF domain-containing protein [Candidatus Sulfotelmatobacter sp.]
MSQHSTQEERSAETVGALRLEQVNISEQEAANFLNPLTFPGEDRGQSLVDMAQRDLDAALQLLAERAQYITGATGAAIALRQVDGRDMLCRASAGVNAPELGAVLSAEFGLSGESVRTQQPLRCDDAENDARVNRESCRALGIASVAVVPVVNDGEVLGVFELFSGKSHAFGERDVSALQRLADMVDTAARFARAAESFRNSIAAKEPEQEHRAETMTTTVVESDLYNATSEVQETRSNSPAELEAVSAEVTTTAKRLFWSTTEADSAGIDSTTATSNDGGLDYDGIPAALKELRKCEACGFPVSESRRLCLDCEDKDARGKLRLNIEISAPPVADTTEDLTAISGNLALPQPSDSPTRIANDGAQLSADDTPIFSAATGHSPSWWGEHKYVVGAVLAVALAIAAVAFFR